MRTSKQGAATRAKNAPADPRTDGATKKRARPAKVVAHVPSATPDLLPPATNGDASADLARPPVLPVDPTGETVVESPLDPPIDPTAETATDIVDRAPVEIPTIVPAEPEPESTPGVEPEFEPMAEPEFEPMAEPEIGTPVDVPGELEEFTDTDGTNGLPSLRRPKKPPRALRAPVVLRRPRRPRVRRVTRVVRQVDTWSVFKVALVFSMFLYFVCMTAGVLLWQVAQNTGTVDNVERFFESFGWQTFQLKGGEIYHNAWVSGLFLALGLTGVLVLAATLFNLITDLVGGIRVTVLEEEVLVRADRGIGWRRAKRPEVVDADVFDEDGGPPTGEVTEVVVPSEPV